MPLANPMWEQGGRSLVHLNEVALRLDGAPGSRDPRGMAAREIALDLHAVSADEAPLHNLLMVVNRCYLEPASCVPAPLASALAATSEDERRLGVTAIDIGAGTTSLAMFAEDRSSTPAPRRSAAPRSRSTSHARCIRPLRRPSESSALWHSGLCSVG